MGDTLSEMKDLQEPITSTFNMDYSKNIIKLEISENETSYLIRQ